ncbi:hypothetical protein LOAG_12253 [Loa loa]|uniref:Uncharacterized protein n=1 Tax=Loa loa TaxID=7209 RepID=A0A1S0TLK0_LOALO|nr:hypothetical protein LOAG_12253 [Loa loa]EFO16252.1 hypothetical protein LOAG_12253 [Loa loa]
MRIDYGYQSNVKFNSSTSEKQGYSFRDIELKSAIPESLFATYQHQCHSSLKGLHELYLQFKQPTRIIFAAVAQVQGKDAHRSSQTGHHDPLKVTIRKMQIHMEDLDKIILSKFEDS